MLIIDNIYKDISWQKIICTDKILPKILFAEIGQIP